MDIENLKENIEDIEDMVKELESSVYMDNKIDCEYWIRKIKTVIDKVKEEVEEYES